MGRIAIRKTVMLVGKCHTYLADVTVSLRQHFLNIYADKLLIIFKNTQARTDAYVLEDHVTP